jgi:hypothetical protein
MLIALGVVVALVAACALTHYGFVALAHLGVGKARRRGVLWGFAVFTGVALVVLYAWGLLYVAGGVLEAEDGGADSSPFRPCRTSGWEARDIVDYRVEYLPIAFVCETSDGESYVTEEVPAYVNPALLGLAMTAVGFGVAIALDSERRARAEHRKAARPRPADEVDARAGDRAT